MAREVVERQEQSGVMEREFFRLLQTDIYVQKVNDMLSLGHSRLSLNLDDLRALNPSLPALLLAQPIPFLSTLEHVLQDAVRDVAPLKKSLTSQYRLTIEGNFGTHYVSPRGLRASLANQLVKVQGIVSRMSLVRPKLLQSVHYCDATGLGHVKVYSGQYEVTQGKNGSENSAVPLKDGDGNPLQMEFGLSLYKDTQTLLIQEFPEKIPTGQLPRTVEIALEEDLVDAIRPGDRIEVVGVYKAISTATSGMSGTFKAVVLAVGVAAIRTEESEVTLTGVDVRDIKAIAAMPDALYKLGQSLAPSIYGHDEIKQALILQALGGCEKNLPNGTHLRGDVNILLIGDPSTAKSQLLRTILHTAPLASCTTGRGSSGVGLTAAIIHDKDTGERHLAAGAMVLADRGVICIDEFDKMEDADRVAIHEVMEQQTVTIAKAGVHASLNARCSVLAAANPIYGTYAPELPPSKNIGLPDSLLSRFDLLFIVLDHKSSEIDRKIAERVVRNHSTGQCISDQFDTGTEVLEERPPFDESARKSWYRADGQDLIHRSLLKKFIHYAKSRVKPELTTEASLLIAGAWAEIRTMDSDPARKLIVPITVRTLETMIRLATACAKVTLSNRVELVHCHQAIELLKHALNQEENTSDTVALGQAVEMVARMQLKRRREEDGNSVTKLVKLSQDNSPVSPESKKQLFRTMLRLSEELEMSILNINSILPALQLDYPGLWTSKDQMLTVLRALAQEDKLVLQEAEQTATLTVA